MSEPALTYSVAVTGDDFEQVFRLNHATFAGEIPQHAATADGRLIDRFHAQNEYLLCKHGNELVGMLALRALRPFSLDQKLPNLDAYLPPMRQVCEVRLLSVKPAWRHRGVFAGLVRALARRCAQRGLDCAVISATTRQLKLYHHLGFKSFGPLTGTGGALFQPMALTLEDFNARVDWLAADIPMHAPLLLTPGPVEMTPRVHAAASAKPRPHRSAGTMALLSRCRSRLCTLTAADEAQILLGSGTLANDAIAQQLRSYGSGLVLANGEFGERVIDHAVRAGLDADTHRIGWGERFDLDGIAAALRRRPAWIWMVQCETSTGMHNDAAAVLTLAQRLGAELVLDCISALGNRPISLAGVLFASGVSGKGIGAPSGLSFVLHRRDALHAIARVPRYLDLQYAAKQDGMPFTQSSSLLTALLTALDQLTPEHFAQRAAITHGVRRALAAAGVDVVTSAANAASGIVTIALPAWLTPHAVGEILLREGFQIAFESAYLRARNWIQVAWMGNTGAAQVLPAIDKICALHST